MTTDLHVLSGAYALDALDDVERLGYERHLLTCHPCATEVSEFLETGAGLADPVHRSPSRLLRARVMVEMGRTRQVSRTPTGSTPWLSPSRALIAAATAQLVTVALALSGVIWA